VAEDKTVAGWTENRRVEIRLLVNKGIAGQVGQEKGSAPNGKVTKEMRVCERYLL